MSIFDTLQENYNKQYKTLSQRLQDIDKQKSGMVDFYKRADPIVNEQVFGKPKPVGMWQGQDYKNAYTDSLDKSSQLGDLNDEKYNIYDSLIKTLQAQAENETEIAKEKEKDEVDVVDELFKKRKVRLDQGVSTDDIDAKLESMGIPIFGMTQAKKALLDSVNTILERTTIFGKPASNAVTGMKNPLSYLFGKADTVENEINSLKAQLSLANIEKLKGAISDKDLEVLKSAGSALGLNQHNKDFIATLRKLKKSLDGSESSEGSITTSSGSDFTIIEE